MKATLVLGLVLFGAAIAAGYAYRLSLSGKAQAARGPEIEFDQQVDFGPREQGSIVNAPVVVYNRGDRPLILSEVRSDCSCSGLEQEVGGRLTQITSVEIEPGCSVSLTSRLIVRGRPGAPEAHKVWFRTNDPAIPEAAITLAVPMVIGVSVSPLDLRLGDVLVGSSAEQVIEVRHTGGQPVVLDQVISSDPSVIRCDLVQPSSDRKTSPLGGCRVKITPSTVGPSSGQVTIRYRREGIAYDTVVPVTFRGASVVELHPALVRLPVQSGNGSVYQSTVLCRSHGSIPFTLSVDEVPAGVTATIAAPTGTGVEVITITLNPRAAGGEKQIQTVRLTAERAGERIPIRLLIERLP
jgi:hypothetical protein